MNMKFEFMTSDQSFNVEFDSVIVMENREFPYYEGNYEVTPDVLEQKLDTKQKIMREDVVVKAIPYSETTNNAGGKTVYIGML